MSVLITEKLIDDVIAIARRAGEEILDVYDSGDIEVSIKSDDTPLTIADLRAQRAILGGLSVLTPGVPVLSEEGAQVPYEERLSWKQYWLVDPLDGTKEFLSGNGEFTVNIALITARTPVIGVVHVPARGTTYWGWNGVGAWRQTGAERQERIQAQLRAPSRLRVVGSKSHRGDSLDGFLTRVGMHELMAVGSSLKFCMVAEGSADLYPRLGPTSEWDTAAAQAVVAGAGGVVVQMSGAPLEYNTKDNLLNPSFLVYADQTQDWLSLLR